VYSPAGIDSSGRTDVSQAMAGFFASVPNGSTIDIPAGTYLMSRTLLLQNRTNLVIRAAGATFTTTESNETLRPQLRLLNSRGITITGLTVRGTFAPGLAQNDARWGQHGIDINSSSGVVLDGISVANVYGDLVYIGQRDGGPVSDGVTVRNCNLSRSGRQGFTMTGARNIVLQGCSLSDVMRSSIDMEPGRDAGMSVENVRITGNQVRNGRLYFVAARGHGPINNIVIENNNLSGMTMAMTMGDGDGGVRRGWTITGNRSDLASGNPQGAVLEFDRINGLTVRSNTQPLQAGRNMYLVKARNSCNVSVSANAYPGGVGELSATGSC
jgi:hypothetical protein